MIKVFAIDDETVCRETITVSFKIEIIWYSRAEPVRRQYDKHYFAIDTVQGNLSKNHTFFDTYRSASND